MEVAASLGDDEAARLHAGRFSLWARRTESAALIARCKRASRGRAAVAPDGSIAEPSTIDTTHGAVSAVVDLLERHQGSDRARAALRWMVESSGASSGCLLLGEHADNLRVAAHYPDGAAPAEDTLHEVVKALQLVEAATAHLDDQDAPTAITEVDPEGSMNAPTAGSLTVQALIADDSGATTLVGAVALQLDAGQGTPLRRAALSAIAKSLGSVASGEPRSPMPG